MTFAESFRLLKIKTHQFKRQPNKGDASCMENLWLDEEKKGRIHLEWKTAHMLSHKVGNF